MIQIINTGVANIRSLQATFDRLEMAWQLTTHADDVRAGQFVVLPGVGAFAAAVEAIDRMSLRQPIIERVAANRPLLCICLGMQLLAESSEESPGAKGLGVISAPIRRFSSNVQVPQLGWNQVQPERTESQTTVEPVHSLEFERSAGVLGERPFESGEAYFANSFRLVEPPAGWGYAVTNYDGPFISSIWRGQVLACQFHPELSGAWGEQLIRRWLNHQVE